MTIEYDSMMLQGQQRHPDNRRSRDMLHLPTDHATLRSTSFNFPGYLIDVSIVILKAIRFDLTGQHVNHDVHLGNFISHVFQTSKLSYSVLLSGLLYLLRFRYRVAQRKTKIPELEKIESPNITYSLFLAAVVLSSKLLNDQGASNKRWSVYTGLPLTSVNHAEIMLLSVIDYKININKFVFDDWVKFLFRSEYLAAYKTGQQIPMEIISVDDTYQRNRRIPGSGLVSRSDHVDCNADGIVDILLEFSNPKRIKDFS